MTPNTDQLKDLLTKVTPGWTVKEDGCPVFGDSVEDAIGGAVCGCVKAGSCDATLIALAPTLAAEVVRLREALTRIDRMTEEAPFDFGLMRLVSRQALDATTHTCHTQPNENAMHGGRDGTGGTNERSGIGADGYKPE